jgi:TetR/AcrR family transcriptional repressor of nem operon
MMMNIILTVKLARGSRFRMGHSRAAKAASHDRVVRVAAARFREAGIEGIGVADLMKDAGLTHGGFYRHFASRDELVAEAVEIALLDGGKSVAAFEQALDDDGKRGGAAGPKRQAVLAALVEAYLSTEHRDRLATSCAVTTLAGDVARSNERARAAYTRQVGSYLELLGKLIAGEKRKAKRTKAIAALSTLVGAVSMSRAVNDEKLSREILKSAADELKAQLG